MFICSCCIKTPAVLRILWMDFSAHAFPPWSKTFEFFITTLKPMRCQVLCGSDCTAKAAGSWSHIEQMSPWPRYCKYFTISRAAWIGSFCPLKGVQPTEPLWESCETNVVGFALSSSSLVFTQALSSKCKIKTQYRDLMLTNSSLSSLSWLSGFPLLLTHASHHAAQGVCVDTWRCTSPFLGRSANCTDDVGWLFFWPHAVRAPRLWRSSKRLWSREKEEALLAQGKCHAKNLGGIQHNRNKQQQTQPPPTNTHQNKDAPRWRGEKVKRRAQTLCSQPISSLNTMWADWNHQAKQELKVVVFLQDSLTINCCNDASPQLSFRARLRDCQIITSRLQDCYESFVATTPAISGRSDVASTGIDVGTVGISGLQICWHLL